MTSTKIVCDDIEDVHITSTVINANQLDEMSYMYYSLIEEEIHARAFSIRKNMKKPRGRCVKFEMHGKNWKYNESDFDLLSKKTISYLKMNMSSKFNAIHELFQPFIVTNVTDDAHTIIDTRSRKPLNTFKSVTKQYIISSDDSSVNVIFMPTIYLVNEILEKIQRIPAFGNGKTLTFSISMETNIIGTNVILIVRDDHQILSEDIKLIDQSSFDTIYASFSFLVRELSEGCRSWTQGYFTQKKMAGCIYSLEKMIYSLHQKIECALHDKNITVYEALKDIMTCQMSLFYDDVIKEVTSDIPARVSNRLGGTFAFMKYITTRWLVIAINANILKYKDEHPDEKYEWKKVAGAYHQHKDWKPLTNIESYESLFEQ